jgi:hypothetical protein
MQKIKVILILAGSLISGFCHSQNLPVDETTKLFTYKGVSSVPGAGADSLFNKALAWCNDYFANPTDVIREKNSKEGKIVCKARFKIFNPADKKGLVTDAGQVMYTLTLQFREGRYKYVITDFNWKQTSYYAIERWTDKSNQYYKPEFENYLQQVDAKANEIMKSLHEAMLAKEPMKDDNW